MSTSFFEIEMPSLVTIVSEVLLFLDSKSAQLDYIAYCVLVALRKNNGLSRYHCNIVARRWTVFFPSPLSARPAAPPQAILTLLNRALRSIVLMAFRPVGTAGPP